MGIMENTSVIQNGFSFISKTGQFRKKVGWGFLFAYSSLKSLPSVQWIYIKNIPKSFKTLLADSLVYSTPIVIEKVALIIEVILDVMAKSEQMHCYILGYIDISDESKLN